MKLSVVVCTYNPIESILKRVIESLKCQTLDLNQWELIIVDNNSSNSTLKKIDLSWHSDYVIVKEYKQGLINARVCGTLRAKYDIIISVDDDTLLCPDYLESVRKIYTEYPNMGMIGGRSYPEFEKSAPDWIDNFFTLLAIRDLGDKPIIQSLTQGETLKSYPHSAALLIAPKKKCMIEFIEHFKVDKISKTLGRKGSDLASGEDNDINLFIYKSGYEVGYFPQLSFIHIIPAFRLDTEYLAKLQYNTSKTWVRVLNKYGICPWPQISKFTLSLRKLKAWVTYKAWASPVNFIKWRGACGNFEARSK